MSDRFICESCGTRYPASGDCSSCEDEPLLDLADDDVRLMLATFDDARWRKRAAIWTGVCIVVMLPLLPVFHWLLGTKPSLAIYTVFVIGCSATLTKKFPGERRLPELGESELREWSTEGS